MKKKGFSFAAMTVIAMLVFGVFMAIPAFGQAAYPADTALYPAVYGAFLELYPNARYINIDFYNDTYTLTGISGRALLVPISYDITVRLNNGRLEFAYDNIHQRNSNGRWERIRAFGMYNYNNAVNAIRNKILEIGNNSALFERHQRAAMADIFFVNSIMKDMTELAFRDFIDNHAKGSVFNITGRISEVTENNREVEGVAYRYRIRITLNTTDPSDAFLAVMPNISCSFFTNQDNVIRLSRNADFSVQGTLIGATRSGNTFSLTLVDTR